MNQITPPATRPEKIEFIRYGISLVVLWTLIIASSLLWARHHHKAEVYLLGNMQGQAFFEKDLLYRRWATLHGGVYVPVSESTPPNPALAHLPERDIVTPSGRLLTLMNPAYMVRQVFALEEDYQGAGRGHITSLKPIRAGNVPDEWEKKALLSFERGVLEVSQLDEIDGKPYFRYMQALLTDKGCLKCHLSQGYREGDVQGGISVSVDLEPLYALKAKEWRGAFIIHSLLWLLGIGGIGFGTHLLGRKSTRLYQKTLELEVEVAERIKMEELLRDAKSAAEAASIAKSQFLANMSHEIRTPMNGVLGMAQLLELTSLTPAQREYTAALKLSGNNLMSLINDILDLSKIEAGKVEIVSSAFSLQQCIHDTVLMQRSAIFAKGLKLHVAVADDLPHLFLGDQLRIKQILLNLLGNAVKFTAEGSIQLSAQLLEQHGNSVLVQLAVRDSGIGIAPAALNTIFAAFSQEDASTTRHYGGTGLGLSISRRLAELMGGEISVESTQGVGSYFTLTLPLIVAGEVSAGHPATATLSLDRAGRRLRILYAEDDAINITFASALFNKLGHDFVVVNNGRECLAALQNGRFDLVLMDIQMPVMSGKEALLEIRRKERDSGLHQPVIAVTAHAMRGDQVRFLQEGFDGYVAKPLMTSDLLAEIKRVMKIETEPDHGERFQGAGGR